MDLDTLPILLTSNEPWGEVWFSKQHYANELTKLGHKVIFLNPPLYWSPLDLFSFQVKTEKTPEGITIANYHNNLPVRIFPKLCVRINDFLNRKKIEKAFPADRYLIWQFDPNRFAFLNKQKYIRLYHVADPYIQLPLDHLLTVQADLVVCTSPKYLPHYTPRNNKVIFIPHGISEEEFQIDSEKVQSIQSTYGKYVLIVGTLNDTVDYSIFESISRAGYTVVVIGSLNMNNKDNQEKWRRVKEVKGVEYLGPKHAKELKNYIHAARLCITAYKFDLVKSVGTGSPLKILNYLTQYKPTVTSIDSEIPDVEGKGVYWGKNLKEYMAYIDRGMKGQLDIDKEQVDALFIKP